MTFMTVPLQSIERRDEPSARREEPYRDTDEYEVHAVVPPSTKSILRAQQWQPTRCGVKMVSKPLGGPAFDQGESKVQIKAKMSMCCAGVRPTTPGTTCPFLKNPPSGPLDSS